MIHAALIITHVVAGTVGLVLGPFVMHQDTRRLIAGAHITGRAGRVYRAVVLVICLSAGASGVGDRPHPRGLIPLFALAHPPARPAYPAGRPPLPGVVAGYLR